MPKDRLCKQPESCIGPEIAMAARANIGANREKRLDGAISKCMDIKSTVTRAMTREGVRRTSQRDAGLTTENPPHSKDVFS